MTKRSNAVRKQEAIPGQVAAQAPETVKAAPTVPQTSASITYMIQDGQAVVNASAAPVIHPADVLQSGAVRKNLALNLLAGTVDAALFNRDADCWKSRAVKDDKMAFFRLSEHSAEEMRKAWATDQEARKAKGGRLTQVSLQALAKLFKPARAGNTVPPITRLKMQVLEIIERKGVKAEKKLSLIAELCNIDE